MSSATDVNVTGGNAPEEQARNGQVATKKRRSNPVALEVPVSVTGARPATSQDKRDLFTEETHTVLVFKDGAVIQLSAAITVGQLLFLTEKRSKREVVCQVVHKRNHRPTSCFVELEFTEEADNFWGVSFPANEDAATIPQAAEEVESEEPTEDDPEEPVQAPKTEDVAQLKGEVEALRAQLQEMKEKQAAEEREAQGRKLAEAEAAARAAAENEARQKAEEVARKKAERAEAEKAQAERARAEAENAQKAKEGSLWQSTELEAKKPEEPSAAEQVNPAPAAVPPPSPPPEPPPPASQELQQPQQPQRIGMRLPTAGLPQVWTGTLPGEELEEKSGIDPLEDLLPKPALDFSKAKGLDPNDPYNIYKPLRRKAALGEIIGAAVVVMILIGGGGFAWYENWLPFLHRAPKTSVAASAPAATNPAQTNSSASAANGTTNGAAGAGAATTQPAGTAGGAATTEAPGNAATDSAAEAETNAGTGNSEPPAEKPAKRSAGDEKASRKNAAPTKTAAAKTSKNHGKAETSAESKPQPAAIDVVSDAPVLPAKLVRSVQPVYPPDAMRGYITGDVRIEAEVDAQGHIGAMKILVGPAPLRQAAIDALKQYEYAPATQGGKPVASKVTVTVKFWFDP